MYKILEASELVVVEGRGSACLLSCRIGNWTFFLPTLFFVFFFLVSVLHLVLLCHPRIDLGADLMFGGSRV